MKEILIYGLPTLLLLIGIALGISGIRTILAARTSRLWPHVHGVVVDSHVELCCSDDNTSYDVIVRYEYHVSEMQFVGTRISYGDHGSGNKLKQETIASKYPAGHQVNVYYDPENPQASILKQGVRAGTCLELSIGLFFAAIGGVMLSVFLNA